MRGCYCWLGGKYLLLILFLCNPAASAFAKQPPLQVIIPGDAHPELEHIRYFHELIDLALRKTSRYPGDYRIVFFPQVANYERYLRELKAGNLDVLWTNSNAERERDLQPIRLSLLKDLNSYRLLMIRREDQPLFAQVRNLDDLRKLRCGLGTHWPDTEIVRSNGFEVITALRQDSLYRMLSSKRFDFFPRGLYEVWREAKTLAGADTVIEQKLMLYYQSPVYFFVNKNNRRLAKRLARGLALAQADGSFDQLFFSVPSFKRGYEELNNSQRLLLRLESP